MPQGNMHCNIVVASQSSDQRNAHLRCGRTLTRIGYGASLVRTMACIRGRNVVQQQARGPDTSHSGRERNASCPLTNVLAYV